MGKNKKRVVSPSKPKRNVSIDNKSELQDIIYIDFNKYPKWTSSVRIGNFTNHFRNSDQALKHFFFIVDQLIPSIEDYGGDIFSGKAKHCHRLTGEQQGLALKIIKEIHGSKILDKESELWQIGGKTKEIRIIGTFVNGSVRIFYPLFIDHHHLLYPSQKYNQSDYKKFNFSTENIK